MRLDGRTLFLKWICRQHGYVNRTAGYGNDARALKPHHGYVPRPWKRHFTASSIR